MIYLFLANGFEEIEALATVDIIKRAGIKITTVGVGGNEIIGAHNISVKADISDNQLNLADADMVILPGGMPGTTNLSKSEAVKNALKYCTDNNKYISAICAAPSVLGKYGLLGGKDYTCYPGCENGICGNYTKDKVTVDGKIITGIGPGATFDFAFKIIEILCGIDKVNLIKSAMQC